jgi:hypothetical protein
MYSSFLKLKKNLMFNMFQLLLIPLFLDDEFHNDVEPISHVLIGT